MRVPLILTLLLGLLCILACSSVSKTSRSDNDGLKSFIPTGYELLGSDSALLNDDPYFDYLLAIKKTVELEEDSRPLLLIISDSENSYKLKFRNDSALYWPLDGPYPGFDCFSGLELHRDSIVISYYGGMSTRWSETHKFLFDQEHQKYLLSTIVLSTDNIYDDMPADITTIEGYLNEKIALDSFSVEKISM